MMKFHAAGKDFAVWRGKDSQKPFVIDAYCPHLGAHIGMGSVKGDDAQCPFHLWCFDHSGKCSDIYYNQKSIPRQAKVNGYKTVDHSERVWFYWKPDCESPEPEFDLPDMAEFNGRYVVEDISRDIKIHAWEALENCSDPIHFDTLHSHPYLVLPWIGSRSRVIYEKYECVEEDWVLNFKSEPVLELPFKIYTTPPAVKVHVRMYGMTCILFDFTIRGLGKLTLIKSLTQINPIVCVERNVWYAETQIPRAIVWWMTQQGSIAFAEDFVAWEHKIFRKQPLLVHGDGNVMKRRNWMKRFFPQGLEVKLDW